MLPGKELDLLRSKFRTDDNPGHNTGRLGEAPPSSMTRFYWTGTDGNAGRRRGASRGGRLACWNGRPAWLAPYMPLSTEALVGPLATRAIL
jgi:hypothetical protein